MEITPAFAKLLLFWAAAGGIAAVIGLWLAYVVLRAAIRDGIDASRLPEAVLRAAAMKQRAPLSQDMRADP